VKRPQRHNVRTCRWHGGYGHIHYFTEILPEGVMARLLIVVPSGEEAFGLPAGQWALMHDRNPSTCRKSPGRRGSNLGSPK